jgi:O-antigen/teichoic acid export membrane protein
VTKRSSVSGLFKHTFIYGLGDLARKLVGFLLIPLYTRYMSPGQYGILQLSLVFIAFWQILYSFGMTTAFFRYYLDTRDDEARKRVFSTTLWSVLFIDLLLSVLMIKNVDTISDLLFGDPGEGAIVVLVVFVLFIESIVQIPLLLLRALDRSRTFLMFVIIQLSAALIANYVLVAHYGMGPYGAILANLLSSGLLLALLVPVAVKSTRFTFARETFVHLLRYGLPFIPSAISMMVMNISDQYLLRYFRGLEETGLYALSYKFGMAINLFITGFRYAWIPFIFRVSGEPDANKLYARTFEITSVILAFLFFGICTFLPEIYYLLVDRSYYGGMVIVPLVAFSYILFGLHIIFIAGVYLEDQTPFIAKVGTTAAVINVLLNLLLIPEYGMWGASVTTLASFSVLIVLVYIKAQKVHPIPFDLRRVASVLLISLFLVAGVRYFDWGSPLMTVGIKLLTFAIFLFILRSMGYIRKQKLKEILNWWRREPGT